LQIARPVRDRLSTGEGRKVVDTSSADQPEPVEAVDRVVPAPRAYSRKTAVSWIAGFLGVLLALELGLHAASSHLSDPVDYVNAKTQTFVHDMDVLKAAGIRSDLTFVGDSLVERDIDAAKFEGNLPNVRWAHDVGIGGFQITTTRPWLLDQVIPRIAPRRVVIGISSSDFNAGRDPATKTLPKYEAARATKPGLDGGANRVLENLALSKYRTELRDPYQLYQAAQGKATHLKTSGTLESRAKWKLGYPKATPAQLARGRRTSLNLIRTQELRNFSVGADEMRAYTDMLQSLRSKGIAAAVVIMPVSSQYIAAHPRGTADFAAWQQAVTAAAAAEHVPVLDMSHSMNDADFRDYEHLEVAPAEQFTSLLLDRLRTLGW
jgi:hypothetical protein